MTCAVVGVGGNLDDPVSHVARALGELEEIAATSVLKRSSLYCSPPLGGAAQPDYINAVALLETALEPHLLLGELQAIEAAHGRERGAERWAARTLDLDLLLYGELQLHDERLTVPHTGIAERAFVLYPLHEIAPEMAIPGYGHLAELMARLPATRLTRVPVPELAAPA